MIRIDECILYRDFAEGKILSEMDLLMNCMASEIIGLSHREREIIANVVKFNTKPFIYYNESPETRHMDRGDYMLVAKLSAILRLANGLDQSYRQKIAEIAVTRKDPELTVTVDPKEDFALEKGIFEENKAFFEEVFGLKAELKLKKKKG